MECIIVGMVKGGGVSPLPTLLTDLIKVDITFENIMFATKTSFLGLFKKLGGAAWRYRDYPVERAV